MISEDDDWQESGPNILAPEVLAKIRVVLEQQGPVILEHRFYRSSRSPSRMVFEEHADVVGYLEVHAKPGDSFRLWNYVELCRDDNGVARGKYPDARGRTPRLGAY